MANDDLIFRVQRLYAAIGAVEETNISKFVPQVINDEHRIGFYQDWSGGLSNAELTNIALSLIHNIANLKDNLKKVGCSQRQRQDSSRCCVQQLRSVKGHSGLIE